MCIMFLEVFLIISDAPSMTDFVFFLNSLLAVHADICGSNYSFKGWGHPCWLCSFLFCRFHSIIYFILLLFSQVAHISIVIFLANFFNCDSNPWLNSKLAFFLKEQLSMVNAKKYVHVSWISSENMPPSMKLSEGGCKNNKNIL